MNYYSRFTDEQIDLLKLAEKNLGIMIAMSKIEAEFTKKYGKVHAITVDFRKEFLIPARQLDIETRSKMESEGINDILIQMLNEKYS